ncbi:ABC transporter ATP-binding protein [Leifsonia shinshuensis]|uniref:ABC transporter ATP-binding protein n=1 Tax=Leifsonia shinshuensis TaxID=150026 RepID=UPI001F50E582|nr:ABC transporter ATP-binding protein [Leifsonia shinshuensis]MCI0156289.1 ABC transporter ATP-binding protein [Leifsonia shinshuensis]
MTTTTTPSTTSAHGPLTTREPAIRIVGLRKSFAHVEAVSGIDLLIEPGETVALLGANGAGKSTTIGMLLGTITPDSGSVLVEGRPPRPAVAAGRIAAMMQDTGLMPGVSVRELVCLTASFYSDPADVDEVIGAAGLREAARRRVDRLSGGQAQRLRFALVAVANPAIMVLDEPTRAMDVQARADFWSSIRSFAATGRTVLFATHYLDEVDGNADRVVVMARGRVIVDGTPAELRSRSGVSTVCFRTNDDDDRDALARLDAVADVARIGGRVVLRTSDPDRTVRSLVASGVTWHDLEVAPPSLDDTFLELTQERS